jgi:hypothetical protein
MRPSLLVVAAALAVAPFPQDSRPPSSPTPSPSTAPATVVVPPSSLLVLDPVVAERAANQKVFDEQYLAVKEALFEACAGRWIAIADGSIWPRGVKGGLEPAQELDILLRALAEGAPSAKHRFVFRIGEEGDARYHFTLCDRPEFVGHLLLTQIGNVWISANDGVLRMPHDGPITKEAVPLGRGGASDLVAEIGAPDAVKLIETDFMAANIYGGTAVVSAARAAALGLERWEVPGRVHSAGRREMRRARLTFRIPKIGFDRQFTVAVEDR